MPRENLPFIQLYPGEWFRDVGVQSLSHHYKGIWIEILMFMHDSEDRGRLVANSKPVTAGALGRLLGIAERDAEQAVQVLLESGVASRDEKGALFNRRMVREEEIRRARSAAGHKGGVVTSELFFAKAKVQAKPKQTHDIDIDSGSDEKRRDKAGQETCLRLGKIFGRRGTTAWSDKEIKALSRLHVLPDELELVERYYSEKLPMDSDFRRRDLLTLLNNWPGEVDRARARPKPKAPRQFTVAPVKVQPPADPVAEADFQRRLAEWKAKGRPLGEFPKMVALGAEEAKE